MPFMNYGVRHLQEQSMQLTSCHPSRRNRQRQNVVPIVNMMDTDAWESALDAVTTMQATLPINETKGKGANNGILVKSRNGVLYVLFRAGWM